MNSKHQHRGAVFVVGAVLLLVIGCAGSSKPSSFYFLPILPESEAVGLKEGGVSIEVGPISVPTYLDTTQITTAGKDNRIYTDQFNRWAEPLKDSFQRVLTENLAILLKTVNVYMFPQRREVAADFQIEITVSRFYAQVDGTAVLTAYFTVIGDDGNTVLARKRSSIAEQAASKDIGAFVAAQSKTLEVFCREIADEIKKLQ